MTIDPTRIAIWVEFAGKMIQIATKGVGEWRAVAAQLAAEDTETLTRLEALLEEGIARSVAEQQRAQQDIDAQG